MQFIDMCNRTVTYPLMDSSKSYINREPSSLVGRLDRNWIFDWQVSLAYATTFLCILLLQYIRKLIPCSELSFRGSKLGSYQYDNYYWVKKLKKMFACPVTTLPHLNLSCLIFFFYLTPAHTLLTRGKEETERAGVSRVEAKTERTGSWAPA